MIGNKKKQKNVEEKKYNKLINEATTMVELDVACFFFFAIF